MQTERLTQPITEEQIQSIESANSKYQIQITLADLIQSQLTKSSQ
jgi:hypothetical protein